MKFYVVFYVFIIVRGQLSIDELFLFNSKYVLTGDCNGFQYKFFDFLINSNVYNQFILNCNESSFSFRDADRLSSTVCPKDEEYFQYFLVRFPDLSSETSIQVNRLQLHGIELCSVDNIIQSSYNEYSYYRSQAALLVNIENFQSKIKYHFALTTNGEMTFIVLLLSSSSINSNMMSIENNVELVFPNENIFRFNLSMGHIWRIDQGYVRTPAFSRSPNIYQLSKTKFSLFNNETFFLYGTQISYPRRFDVSVDNTPVSCTYNHILRCTFPILPLNTLDNERPVLKIIYNKEYIINISLTLNPRTRLQKVPTQHPITKMKTFEVNIDENSCINNTLKSTFSFIVHLSKEDVNGTMRYQLIVKNDIGPIDCNQTVSIGQEIEKVIQPTTIDDIISLNVDLAHQWHDNRECGTEWTRVQFF